MTNIDDRGRQAAAAARATVTDTDTDALFQRITAPPSRWRWLVPAVAVAGAAALAMVVIPIVRDGATSPNPDVVSTGDDSPAPTSSGSPQAAVECDSYDSSDPVRATSDQIRCWAEHALSDGGDETGLVDLALEHGRFTYSFGGYSPPSREELLDAWGRTDFENMITVLDLPYGTKETQLEPDVYSTIYVWPSAFGDNPTDADWQAVEDSGLHTAEEIEQMHEFGGYTGWRIGITEDGDWLFFVAGD